MIFTDGSPRGTSLLLEDSSGSPINTFSIYSHNATVGDLLVFASAGQPWVTDGSTDGTFQLAAPYGATDAQAANFEEFGSQVLFSTRDGYGNGSIWVTDGTASGTVPVGNVDGEVYGFRILNDSQFLVLTTENQLWVSDGTPSGTKMLVEFDGFDASSLFSSFGDFGTVEDGIAYFRATTAGYGQQVWLTDGTVNGTRLIETDNPATASSDFTSVHLVDGRSLVVHSVNSLTQLSAVDYETGTVELLFSVGDGGVGFVGSAGDLFYFSAATDTAGRELWVSDGTASGTHMVLDINPGAGDSVPYEFGSLGNLLLFTAFDPVNGRELWSTDGTADGTQFLGDLDPGANYFGPSGPVEINGVLVFTGRIGNSGYEILASDGTPGGTGLLAETVLGADSAYADVTNGVFGSDGYYYFDASGEDLIYDLWRTDGTVAGTELILESRAAATGSTLGLFVIGSLGDSILVSDGNGLEAVSVGDGTRTQLTGLLPDGSDAWIRSIFSEGDYPTYVNDRYIYVAEDVNGDYLLWSVGEAAGSAEQLLDFAFGSFSLRQPQGGDFVNGGLVVSGASDDFIGSNIILWTDGTAAGTIEITSDDPSFSPYRSSDQWIIGSGDQVFFLATSEAAGRELWVTDGVSGIASMVFDLVPGDQSASINHMMAVDGGIVFVNWNTLYFTDGTEAGTIELLNLASDPHRYLNIQEVTSDDGRMYFTFSSESFGRELWTTDGTLGGTFLVSDFNDDPVGNDAVGLVVVDGAINFDLMPDAFGHVSGTDQADRVDFAAGIASASLGRGNDHAYGAGGDDEISGGEGDDTLRGNDGADQLAGDAGQ